MKNLSAGFWCLIIITGLMSGCSNSNQDASSPIFTESSVAKNFVANGNLEYSEGNNPEQWEAFDFGASPPGKHVYDFDPGTRNHSITVALDKPGASGWRQRIKLDPDSHWIMTCRTKTENIAGRGLGATLFFPRFRYMQPPSVRKTDKWTTISSELVNSGFVEMDLTCTLGAYGGNTGKAVFDDISIIKQINPAYDPEKTKSLQWGPFSVRYNSERGYLTSIKLKEHARGNELDFLASYPTLPYLNHENDSFLGDLALDILQNQSWQRFTTADTDVTHNVSCNSNILTVNHKFPNGMKVPDILTQWNYSDSILEYQITLTNNLAETITVGSVDLPLPWNDNYCLFDPHDKNSQRLLYTRRVAEHKHIGGVSSYILACPMDGSTPLLAVTPGNTESGIEFTYHSPDTIRNQRRDSGRWIHGAWPGLTRICFRSEGIIQRQKWDNWFLGHSSLSLSPNESKTFKLHIRQLNSRDDVYSAIQDSGGLGVRLVPGPACPVGKLVTAIVYGGIGPFIVEGESINNINSSAAEKSDSDQKFVNFSLTEPGEQVVTITDSTGKQATMIMMGLDAVDKLLARRADFILENQLYKADSDPLNGGILCWNNRAENVVANPGDMWGSGGYEGGITDAQFMALKNLTQPDKTEIHQLETYIHEWLLSKIQNPENYGVAWTLSRPERTERGYNYIHVLNLYDAMARTAAVWPESCTHDANHYLQLWIDTFHAFNKRNVKFRDLGLMGRGNIVNMPELLRRYGLKIEAKEVEEEIAQWVEYWVTTPAFPYGSELFFDNTGYETVALYCDYDLRNNEALSSEEKKIRSDLVKQTISVTEAGRGRAPSWFWNDSDQRWWDAVRTTPQYESFTDFGENCHHYMTGLNGYMLLDLFDHQYNRDELAPVGFSGLLTHLGRISETGFAGMCYCPDPSSDNYGLNQFTGDIGLGLWGGLQGLRCYYYNDPALGPKCLGGSVSIADSGKRTLTTWPGFDHKIRWIVEDNLSIDIEGQVIKSVSRSENGSKWIVSLANNTEFNSRDRIVISGLKHGRWSCLWSKSGENKPSSHTVESEPLILNSKSKGNSQSRLILTFESN